MFGFTKEERPNSLLDTDLYKLTMQSCVLRYFPHVQCTHDLSNRTPDKRLNRTAFNWLQKQITALGDIRLSDDEYDYLTENCPYLHPDYLKYLQTFRFRPDEQVVARFTPLNGDEDDPNALGDLFLQTRGAWVETILYEVPILYLVTEAYFRFVSTDWSYDGQVEQAEEKGLTLLRSGCVFSEFATRRRRDFHTQKIVLEGLLRAVKKIEKEKGDGDTAGAGGKFGSLTGTSNVYLAKKFGLTPVGTVAHEWIMGIAAVTNDYRNANEVALRCWVNTFGLGILPIALTDTFGTPAFLTAFRRKIDPSQEPDGNGLGVKPKTSFLPLASTTPLSASPATATVPPGPSSPLPPLSASETKQVQDLYARLAAEVPKTDKTFAQAFTGVRQDSGDPVAFIRTMLSFYVDEDDAGRLRGDGQAADESDPLSPTASASAMAGARPTKTIVFSDSLTVGKCLKYKTKTEEAGLVPAFGIGTNLTNDFVELNTNQKSEPMNIVLKLSSINGRPAIKLSDNVGKHTGDPAVIEEVKRQLGYVAHSWQEGENEAHRWGAEV